MEVTKYAGGMKSPDATLIERELPESAKPAELTGSALCEIVK